MQKMIHRWWEEQNARWHDGGGSIAARLWWLFFSLVVSAVLISPLFYARHGPNLSQARNSNLRQIGVLLMTYVQDYDGQLPATSDLVSLRSALTPYQTQYTPKNVWQPPRLNVAYAVNPSLSRRPFRSYPRPDTVVAVWDSRVHDDGHTVLFLDGHVKFIPLRQWERLRIASGIEQDVSAPPLSWWDTRTVEDFQRYTAGALLLASVAVAFVAAWRDARYRTRDRGGNSWLCFTGWFLHRFLGYGGCIALAALVVSYVIGGLVVLPLTYHR